MRRVRLSLQLVLDRFQLGYRNVQLRMGFDVDPIVAVSQGAHVLRLRRQAVGTRHFWRHLVWRARDTEYEGWICKYGEP